jgi:hypothetical protein
MTYVIESGIAIRGVQPAWISHERTEDRDRAYDRMVSLALVSSRGLYGPHGGRRLRVREIKP